MKIITSSSFLFFKIQQGSDPFPFPPLDFHKSLSTCAAPKQLGSWPFFEAVSKQAGKQGSKVGLIHSWSPVLRQVYLRPFFFLPFTLFGNFGEGGGLAPSTSYMCVFGQIYGYSRGPRSSVFVGHAHSTNTPLSAATFLHCSNILACLATSPNRPNTSRFPSTNP